MPEQQKPFKEKLKQHVVDSTALLAISTPAFSFIETTISGMSNTVSLRARVIAAALAYGGVGSLITLGRDLSRRYLDVTDQTNERTQQLHDMIYLGVFNLLSSPALYLLSGSRDLKEITLGTITATVFGAAGGGAIGYAIDTYRDLTGIQESTRLPRMIQQQPPAVKKTLAALVTAAAISASAGIYAWANNQNATHSGYSANQKSIYHSP